MASKTIKTMGVSPITNTIYYGNVNEEKGLWVGEKKDVTDMAIGAVCEWCLNHVSEFKLKMVREEIKKND